MCQFVSPERIRDHAQFTAQTMFVRTWIVGATFRKWTASLHAQVKSLLFNTSQRPYGYATSFRTSEQSRVEILSCRGISQRLHLLCSESPVSTQSGYIFRLLIHQATQWRSMMPRSSASSVLGGLPSAGPLIVGLSASQYFETTLLRTPNILRGQKLAIPYRSTSLQNSCVKKLCI
jgi:hypothetical protein